LNDPFPLELGDLDDFGFLDDFPPFPLELGALDDFPPFPLELGDLDDFGFLDDFPPFPLELPFILLLPFSPRTLSAAALWTTKRDRTRKRMKLKRNIVID
jgi:hypothetical protein